MGSRQSVLCESFSGTNSVWAQWMYLSWGWQVGKDKSVSLDCSAYTFPVPPAEVDRLKVTFEDTTDFFGRVVIYHLRVLGKKKE